MKEKMIHIQHERFIFLNKKHNQTDNVMEAIAKNKHYNLIDNYKAQPHYTATYISTNLISLIITHHSCNIIINNK